MCWYQFVCHEVLAFVGKIPKKRQPKQSKKTSFDVNNALKRSIESNNEKIKVEFITIRTSANDKPDAYISIKGFNKRTKTLGFR